MPRLKNSTPKYRLYKATGQAIVTLDGKTSISVRMALVRAVGTTSDSWENGSRTVDRFPPIRTRSRLRDS